VGFQEDGSTSIAPFIASNCRNTGGRKTGGKKPFSADADHGDIIEFARGAIMGLKDALNGDLLLGPIIRVDIMLYQPKNGPPRFVVNEFEGLEAGISSPGRSASRIDAAVHCYLLEYWSQQILMCLSELDARAANKLTT